MGGATYFARLMRCFPVVENMLLPFHFVINHVFFLDRWRMSFKNSRFIASDLYFFFPFSSLSYPKKKVNLALIVVGVS